MRWANFLFFVTLQHRVPFGQAAVSSRETFTDVSESVNNTRAEIQFYRNYLRRNDENKDQNNTTYTEDKLEQIAGLIKKNAIVDEEDVKSKNRSEINLEDIQWKQFIFGATDSILFIPYLEHIQLVNQVRSRLI